MDNKKPDNSNQSLHAQSPDEHPKPPTPKIQAPPKPSFFSKKPAVPAQPPIPSLGMAGDTEGEVDDAPTESVSLEELDSLDLMSFVEDDASAQPEPSIFPPKEHTSLKGPRFQQGANQNPYLRDDDNKPKPRSTLLGMVAPDLSSVAPPQPQAPAPGSGAQAMQGRALAFGAQNAFESARMKRPEGLPLDEPAPSHAPNFGSTPVQPQTPSFSQPVQQPAFSQPAQPVQQPSYSQPVQPPAQAYEAEPATMISEAPSHELDLSGDDFDDDFAEQKTEVIQSPFEQEAILPKLRAIDGPMLNHEFILTELRSTIGRGNNNSITVEDLAMSRLHFEIIRNADDSYLIRDLNSANGIALNGTRIKEAVLYDQDQIEAGKSILRFEHASSPARASRHLIAVASATMEGTPLPEPSNPIPEPVGPNDQTRMAALQIDQSTRMFTHIALGAGALCIPLCFLFVFAIISSSNTSDAKTTQPVEDKPAVATAPQQTSGQAVTLFLDGAEAIKEQKWEDAQKLFTQAKTLDANLDISPQLKRIEDEQAALAKITQAKKLTDPEEIKKLVQDIPPQSSYYEEAQTLTQLNTQDIVTSLHQDALTLLQEDKLDEVEQKLKEFKKLSPNHSGIPDIEEKLKTRREELAAVEKQKEEDQRIASKANDLFDTQKSSSSSSSSNKSALSDGYSAYKRKRFSSAISSFKKAGGSKGKRLAKYARTVEQQWPAGEKALKSKKYTSAISALEKAQGADRNINKAHRKEIQSLLAQAYGYAGLAQLKSKKYRSARKYLARGEKLGVRHSSLSELDRGLENEAKKIYIQAVNKKKSDPNKALELCRQIMLMLPSSSPTYKKTQKLIPNLYQ